MTSTDLSLCRRAGLADECKLQSYHCRLQSWGKISGPLVRRQFPCHDAAFVFQFLLARELPKSGTQLPCRLVRERCLHDRSETMDLATWLPAMMLLGLAVMGLMFAFVAACDRV
jgi:hypothetical protein